MWVRTTTTSNAMPVNCNDRPIVIRVADCRTLPSLPSACDASPSISPRRSGGLPSFVFLTFPNYLRVRLQVLVRHSPSRRVLSAFLEAVETRHALSRDVVDWRCYDGQQQDVATSHPVFPCPRRPPPGRTGLAAPTAAPRRPLIQVVARSITCKRQPAASSSRRGHLEAPGGVAHGFIYRRRKPSSRPSACAAWPASRRAVMAARPI